MNETLKALGITEEKAISNLERLIAEDEDIDFYSLDEKMSFEMAISALKDRPKFEGMTNGEVIQALFPNPHIDTKSHTVWVGYEEMSFTRKWWNAPYQKGGE